MANEAAKEVLVVGNELAIVWPDGREDYIPLETLRRACPCALCKGERDIMGNLYKGPDRPLTPLSFQVTGHRRVGGYALQIDWADRHNDGIYSWDGLKEIAAEVRPSP